MELLIKAAVAAVVGSLMALVLRKNVPELGLLLTIAVTLLTAAAALRMADAVIEVARLAQNTANISPAVAMPVLKCVGIGVVTKIAADLCRDAGQSAAGSAVELVGAMSAVYVALPLLRTLLETLESLL